MESQATEYRGSLLQALLANAAVSIRTPTGALFVCGLRRLCSLLISTMGAHHDMWVPSPVPVESTKCSEKAETGSFPVRSACEPSGCTLETIKEEVGILERVLLAQSTREPSDCRVEMIKTPASDSGAHTTGVQRGDLPLDQQREKLPTATQTLLLANTCSERPQTGEAACQCCQMLPTPRQRDPSRGAGQELASILRVRPAASANTCSERPQTGEAACQCCQMLPTPKQQDTFRGAGSELASILRVRLAASEGS